MPRRDDKDPQRVERVGTSHVWNMEMRNRILRGGTNPTNA
jgi:hypothetical protein